MRKCKAISIVLSAVMLVNLALPLSVGAAVSAQGVLGELPEEMYLQTPVGSCSQCGGPLFERKGDWEDVELCYTCWAVERNEYSYITWTPPKPYCVHCQESTLGNTSGYCDDCIMAACGSHTQTVLVTDKESGQPIKGAAVSGGALQNVQTDADGKASISDSYMHLSGITQLKVSCQGYESINVETTVLELSQTKTVELEKLPDSYTIPIKAVEFAAEAFGPVAVDAAAQLDFRPLPMKIDNLLNDDITLQRDPQTGDYVGKVELDRLAKLLFDGNLTLTGNVTARWSQEYARLELVDADVNASVTMSADVGRVFGGVSGELVPNVQLTGAYDGSGNLTLVPRITCNGSVYAYLGPRLEHTITIGRVKTKLGAALNGGVKFNMTAELANGVDIYENYLQLTGNLRAELKLLGIERVWEDFYWQYYPVVEEPAEPPQPVDRFTSRGDSGTANEDSQQFDPQAAPSKPTPGGSPVVEESGNAADPVIVTTGGYTDQTSDKYTGTAAMFWIEDESQRTERNRQRLVYSLYDGDRWSDPLPVHDDGTADFAPRAVYTEDATYIIWQNADKQFDTTETSAEYALSMDIYAAVLRDGEIQEVTNLSDGIDGYCGMHSLSEEDGIVTAVWAANATGDLLFSQGENVGYTAVYQDGGWEVSQSEIESLSAEGNQPTIQLLSAGGEASQQQTVEAAGIEFYLTEEGSLACTENGQQRILAEGIQSTVFEAVQKWDNVFLYWLAPGENGSNRLEGMFYNAATGEVSEVQTYLDHNSFLYEVSVSLDERGAALVAYQSSLWQEENPEEFASSHLMTAAFPPPQWAEQAGEQESMLVPVVIIISAVIAAGCIVGIAVWVIRRKNHATPKNDSRS